MTHQNQRILSFSKVTLCFLLIALSSGFLGCERPDRFQGCGNNSADTPGDDPVVSDKLPIVFVHGGAGSADQFSFQAQRFAGNGYPADIISGFEYDSSMENNTIDEIMSGLEAHIDAVLAQTGAKKVAVAGHSMGTMMSQRFLNSNAQRAAKVAKYINIDGREATSLPGGVPTLAIWAPMSGADREITGGTNVTLAGQTHVQSASSAEAFNEMYTFLTGNKPETVEVLPETGSNIVLAGKLTMFATNLVPEGYTLDLYEVNPKTGVRTGKSPIHSQAVGADGKFEIQKAKAGKNYEFFAHSDKAGTLSYHFYYEPFIRSDYMIRLKLSVPGGTLSSKVDTDEKQTNLTVVRNKELVGDAQSYPEQTPLENDSLTVNGQELCSEALTPAADRVIGLYVFDKGMDGQSNPGQAIEDFASIPFVSGVDLFIPADTPPAETVSIILKGRQNGGLTQVINVPNWSSATDKITVQFLDF